MSVIVGRSGDDGSGCPGGAEARRRWQGHRLNPGLGASSAPPSATLIVSDDDQKAIPERDFARMYKARTGSFELDPVDRPHVALTVVGMVVSGAALGVAGLEANQARHEHGFGGAAFGAAFLGTVGLYALAWTIVHAAQGSPEDHDVPRTRARVLANTYNASAP